MFSTLKALIEVMEVLGKGADPAGVGRQIQVEVRFAISFIFSGNSCHLN